MALIWLSLQSYCNRQCNGPNTYHTTVLCYLFMYFRIIITTDSINTNVN